MIAPRAGALATALVATTIALAAQGSLVRFAYAGNWTALYHSGETYGTSPDLAHEDIHLFAGSYGYDGQIYHVIAHDPLMTTGVSPTIDAPRLRYRRILIPLLAWTLAGGRSAYVDIAYRAVVLASVFLGAFCCAWIAADRGRAPAWGALFLLLPATIVSLERMRSSQRRMSSSVYDARRSRRYPHGAVAVNESIGASSVSAMHNAAPPSARIASVSGPVHDSCRNSNAERGCAGSVCRNARRRPRSCLKCGGV